jgi:membrane protein implicated in regulation of membrane protease activity
MTGAELQTKDMIAMVVLPLAVILGTVLLSLLPRLRDPAFFLMVGGQVVSDKADINILSSEWYRGTTRGFELSFVDILAWALILTTIITPMRHQKRIYWPMSLTFLLLYFGIAIYSVVTSEPKLFGSFEVSKILRAIVAFWAAALHVQSERELKVLVLAIATAVWLQGLLAIKHRVFMHVERATGTLNHANSLSMYLCMTGPFLVAAATSTWKSKWIQYYCYGALAFATIGILLTISRAGIPTFALVCLGAAAFCFSWKFTIKKIAVALVLMCALAGMVALSWDKLAARFGSASLEDEMNTQGFENRGQYFGLVAAILRERSNGVGLNNWSYWVSKRYGVITGTPYEDYDDIPQTMLDSPIVYDWGPKYAPPAHSLGVITVGEMGWIGFWIFAALWVRWLWLTGSFLWRRSTSPLRRMGIGIFFSVCGVFLQSLTEWVFRQTQILLTFHILIGTAASLYYMRNRKWAYQEALEEEPVAERVVPVRARTREHAHASRAHTQEV